MAASINTASGVPEPLTEANLDWPAGIIDRERLAAQLLAAQRNAASTAAARSEVLGVLKQALAAGRAEIRRRFYDAPGPAGAMCVREGAYLIDQLIAALADHAAGQVYRAGAETRAEGIAIAAQGGYGRAEMAPGSDIDLLVLLPYKASARIEQLVEYILYMLWDLGLKVGHATRSVDDCLRQAEKDMSIRTALLETRFLWGRRGLFDSLRDRFDNEILSPGSPASFIEAKLAERDQRHQRLGDSRYVLEPNIKEGKGGLRDLHTLFWIAKYAYRVESVGELVGQGVLTAGEARRFARALNFLWTLRCHLHYLSGRAEERLTFDAQPEIARLRRYADRPGASGVERFMRHYFLIAREVGTLTRILCAGLELEQRRAPRLAALRRLALGGGERSLSGFRLTGERLTSARRDQFERDPVAMLRLFRVAQQHGLGIDPRCEQQIARTRRQRAQSLAQDAAANALLLAMLEEARSDPATTLRRLNEADLLGLVVPEWARIVAQMQYDMYHVYTVDEHSLIAVSQLHQIEQGTAGATDGPGRRLHEIAGKITSRRALYVATLLHDIGKGRGGDHSLIGAELAQTIAPRLGLSAEESETVVWLVQYHLLMSRTAFRRDLEDPKTIADFIAVVRSPERLRLLFLLTAADISAVGPGAWTSWKATLLTDLYERAQEQLSGGLRERGSQEVVASVQARVRELLPDWSEAAWQAHIARTYPGYWRAFDPPALARHAQLMAEADAAGRALSVETRVDSFHGVTELTVYTADHPGLFARLALAITLAGAEVAEARIVTMSDGMALDSFLLQEAGDTMPGARPAVDDAVHDQRKLAKLEELVGEVLAGRIDPDQALASRRPKLPQRARVFDVPPRVLVDNQASNAFTVIEVNARDRPGLLYAVTRTLAAMNVQIGRAKISTFGESAVDVFYIKDLFGLKIDNQRRLEQIRNALLAALDASGYAGAGAADTPAVAARG